MSKCIYMDNAATTQVYPEVFDAMKPYFTEFYGNPSSIYSFAGNSKKAVEMQERLLQTFLVQERKRFILPAVEVNLITGH